VRPNRRSGQLTHRLIPGGVLLTCYAGAGSASFTKRTCTEYRLSARRTTICSPIFMPKHWVQATYSAESEGSLAESENPTLL
jgi:hypothetical protein